jgi:hypothetical protein
MTTAPPPDAPPIAPADPGPAVGDPPVMPWPPSQSTATEPPRDLPMPLAGAHLHLTNRS